MFSYLRVNAAGDALKTDSDGLLIVGGTPPKMAIHRITIEHGPRVQIEHTNKQDHDAGGERNGSDRDNRLQGLIHKRR